MTIRNEITKWNPFRELDDLQERMKSLFLRSGNGGFLLSESPAETDWLPAVDVTEDDKEFTLTADLPNIPKDQVKVTLENRLLTIQGERHQEKEEKKKKFHRIERSYGKYSRSFRLPDSVDASKVEAAYTDGVLTVHLPKSAGEQPSAQEIQVR